MADDSQLTPATQDELASRRLCVAHHRDGTPCRAWAIKGGTVCWTHGGRTPSIKNAARRRVMAAKATVWAKKYGADPNLDPVDALINLIGETIAFKNFIAARLSDIDPEKWGYGTVQGEALKAEVQLYERALDRCGNFLGVMIKLNLEERMARVSEARADRIRQAVVRVFQRVGLKGDQLRDAKTVLAEEFRTLSDARQ